MPNPGGRLHWVSSKGEVPFEPLTGTQWTILEKALGASIPGNARKRIQELRVNYLMGFRAETKAAKETDVRRQAEVVEKALAGFFAFAIHDGIGLSKVDRLSDEWVEFRSRFEQNFKGLSLTLPLGNILAGDQPINDGLSDEFSYRNITFAPDLKFLMELAFRVSSVLQGIRAGTIDHIGKDRTGFVPGSAYRSLLHLVRQWAIQFGFPSAVYRSDQARAGPIAEFVFELINTFPREYRPAQMNSAEAVAGQMKRANAHFKNKSSRSK